MSDTLKRKLSEEGLDLPTKQAKVAASDSPDCTEQSTEPAKDTPATAGEVGAALEQSALCDRTEEAKVAESPPPPDQSPSESSVSAEPAEAVTTQADRGSEAPATTQSDSQST